MIYGVGIDIIKIGRIQNAVERWGEDFLNRVFTREEKSYCYSKKVPFLSLSVRFAAKEALVKAIGSEIHVSYKDIEVVTSDKGKPYIKLYGEVKKYFIEKNINRIHLSLSHEREFGIAYVVLEEG